jgi:uncharacterized protein (DUF2147 family)
MRLILIFGWLFLSTSVMGQETVLGKWKTIDDNTGKARSVVEILERDGAIFGRIVRIFPQPDKDPDPVCNKCNPEDPRYNHKIVGMEIIRDLRKDGSEYSGGDILDPENGKVYRSRIWLDGKVLKVRGYWGPFYRTQTWQRAD